MAQMTVTGDDAALIAQIAQRVGDTELIYDVLNAPRLSVVGEGTSEWFHAEFIGCTDGAGCQAMSLIAEFSALGLTDEQILAFNRDHFYVRAYRAADDSIVIQQDVSLIHGVNDEWLFQTIATYGRLVDIFVEWQSDQPVP
jgi:hypothetical protein